MLYVTIEDAPILIPNKEHSNFTQSNAVIDKGTLIEGNELFINGKRRGEDFTYKLFRTKDNNLIHLKKIQFLWPMRPRQFFSNQHKGLHKFPFQTQELLSSIY